MRRMNNIPSEKLFENRVKSFLNEKGCWYVKYWGGGNFTTSGIPDLLVCCNGYFLGVEIKASTGKVSELQKFHLAKIKESGGIALALYPKDFDNFKKLIENLLKEKKDAVFT